MITAPIKETIAGLAPIVMERPGVPNIYQKIAAISASLGAIQKDGTYDGGQRGGSYKFISHAALMGHLRNELARHNVVIIPEVIEANTEGREKHSTYNGQERVSFERRVTVRMLFTVVDGDDPESKFTAQWSGEGIDAGDKGTQKAGTSAEKYFLFKLFKVSDKDDPDAENPSSEAAVSRPSARDTAPATPPVNPGPDRDPVAGGSGSPTAIQQTLVDRIAAMDGVDRVALFTKHFKTRPNRKSVLSLDDPAAFTLIEEIDRDWT